MKPEIWFLAVDESDVKPGWIALVVVLLLCVATFLLWRSMNSQLRKINVPTRAELRAQRDADESEQSVTDERPDEDHPADGRTPS